MTTTTASISTAKGALNRKQLQYHPKLYGNHAFLHHEIARRMVEYLDEGLTPATILVDGAFDHYLSDLLRQRFPTAEIWENIESITDSAQRFDLVVSNLYLQDVPHF